MMFSIRGSIKSRLTKMGSFYFLWKKRKFKISYTISINKYMPIEMWWCMPKESTFLRNFYCQEINGEKCDIVKPLLLDELNKRCQVDLIDNQTRRSDDHKYVMNYQDDAQKFFFQKLLMYNITKVTPKMLLVSSWRY